MITVITLNHSLIHTMEVDHPARITTTVLVTAPTCTMNTLSKCWKATVQTVSVVKEQQGKFTFNDSALLVEYIPSPVKKPISIVLTNFDLN